MSIRVKNNPSITGKELLNELHKTDSALLDIDIYYEQIAECKTVKFKSGLEGIAFMTVERNLSGGITPRIIFTYVLILDKGLLTISYWPIISSEEEFKAEMAKIGYTELTKLDAVAHKGKEQSINIYNAIKDQTITLNGAYSMYCDYIGLQDTLKVLAQ